MVLSGFCLTKYFPGVKALECVDFEVREGEVHALLGENGAGKSTLVNILSGVYLPDRGRISINGEEVVLPSPKAAQNRGIFMVSQNFSLVETLTVRDNLEIANVDVDRAVELAEEIGVKLDLRRRVEDLSVGEKQRLEIVKAIAREVKYLILDEPTSLLPPWDAEKLFEVIKSMRGRKIGIIFVTHKINEVFEVGDRVTVLRRGRKVGTFNVNEVSPSELLRHMFGEELPLPGEVADDSSGGDLLIKVEDLWVKENDRYPVRGVSLEVKSGEILGVAGVVGNGQKELLEVLGGYRRPFRGRIVVLGRDLTGRGARDFIRAGVSFIPEDRLGVGLARGLNILENFVVRNPPRLINWRKVKSLVEKIVEELDVVLPSYNSPAASLSGGNMQKVLVGREVLYLSPRILVASYPTRGLDYETTVKVHELFRKIKREGGAVVFSSEDIEELRKLSTRILVMNRGRIVDEFNRREPVEKIYEAMAL